MFGVALIVGAVTLGATACGGSTSNGQRKAGAGYLDTRLCVRNFTSDQVSLRMDELVDTGLDAGPHDMTKTQTLQPEATICGSEVNEQGASLVTPKGTSVQLLAWNSMFSSGIRLSGSGWTTDDIYTNPGDTGSKTLPSGERLAWMHADDTDYKEFLVVVLSN